MQTITERSFYINIRLLKLFGFYPSEFHPTVHKIRGLILYITMLVLVVASVTVKIVMNFQFDINEINVMLAYVSECIFLCFKFLPFFINRNRIKNCIHYFGDARFAPRNQEEEEILNDCIRLCYGMSSILNWLVILCVTLWTLPGLFTRRFPMDVWLPYDVSNNIAFYSTFIYLTAASLYTGYAGAMVDPLLGGLMYQAATQLKILKHRLQQLRIYKNSSFIKFNEMENQLKHCIDHHNWVLDFVAEYEDCFSLSLASQIAGCTLTLCFFLIGIILSTTNVKIIQNTIYSLTACCQILFYCYFGTILFEENNTLITAIYMSEWYTYDARSKKLLYLIMERSKVPIIIRAGKLIDLTLRTFTSFLKTSYSLIAVFTNH